MAGLTENSTSLRPALIWEHGGVRQHLKTDRSVLQNTPRVDKKSGQAKKISIAAILSAVIWAVFSTMVLAAGATLVGDQTIHSSVDSNAAGHAEAFRATAT